LSEQTDPAGGTVQLVRDREEDILGIVNELGERYEIKRDLAGRIVKERGFDGRARELWYDRVGRCREMVDAQEKRTKIERDACGRVIKQIVPQKPVLGDPLPKGEEHEYTFDALGRVVGAKNEACAVTFVRDPLGRIVSEQSDGITVESKYDTAGDRVCRRTSLGDETTYDFDGNGDLVGVTLGAGAAWGSFGAGELVPGAATRAP